MSKETENWMEDIFYELRDKVTEAISEASETTLAQAKMLCPVDTGNLRRTISMDIDQNGDDIIAKVKVGASYGIFVELGTFKMFPQPFLFNSFSKAVAQLENTLKNL